MSAADTGGPYVRIVSFRLDGISPAQYRDHCRRIAPGVASWPGLVAKVWLSDPVEERYGGVYLFRSEADADRSRRTELFRGMVSNPAFADLSIAEYRTLAYPTMVTAGPLAGVEV